MDEAALRALQVAKARAAVPWFRVRARRAALAQAIEYSRAMAARQQQGFLLQFHSRQRTYEQEWRALHDNDPDAVRHRLERASLRSEFAIRIDAIAGGAVHLTLSLSGADGLPAVVPTTDDPQCATVEPLSDDLRAELYRQLVAGAVLAIVRQVLAAAPQISRVVVAAQRPGAYDVAGPRPSERILAAVIERRAVNLAEWSGSDAWTVLQEEALDLRLADGILHPGPTPTRHPA